MAKRRGQNICKANLRFGKYGLKSKCDDNHEADNNEVVGDNNGADDGNDDDEDKMMVGLVIMNIQ